MTLYALFVNEIGDPTEPDATDHVRYATLLEALVAARRHVAQARAIQSLIVEHDLSESWEVEKATACLVIQQQTLALIDSAIERERRAPDSSQPWFQLPVDSTRSLSIAPRPPALPIRRSHA